MPGRGRLPAEAEAPTGPFRFLFPVCSHFPHLSFHLFPSHFFLFFLLSSPPKIPSIHFTMANFSSSDVTAVKFVFLFPNSVPFQSSSSLGADFPFFRSTIRTLAADVVAKACCFSTKEHTSNTKLTDMCRLTLVTPVPPWSVCTSVFLLKRCSSILCSQGMAPVAHVLFTRFMRFNSKNPKWINRDRFVLSNGHA